MNTRRSISPHNPPAAVAERFEPGKSLSDLGAESRIRDMKHRVRRAKQLAKCWMVGTLISSICIVFACFAFLTTDFLPYLASGSLAFIATISILVTLTLVGNDAADQAARSRERSLIGPITEMLAFERFGLSARDPLVRLLPYLRPEDACLLNAAHRKRLYRELAGKDVPLILAILKAMENVGDAQALRCAERLAKGKGVAGKDPHIQEAAEQCRQRIQARLACAADTMLLRAAVGPLHTEELVRPAQATAASENDLLHSL